MIKMNILEEFLVLKKKGTNYSEYFKPFVKECIDKSQELLKQIDYITLILKYRF